MAATLLLSDLEQAQRDELGQHVQQLFSLQQQAPQISGPAPTPSDDLTNPLGTRYTTPAPAVPAASPPPPSTWDELASHVNSAVGGGVQLIGQGITSLQQKALDLSSAVQSAGSGGAPSPNAPPTPGGPLQDYARQAATRAGVDPDIFVRQIQQESGFNPNAKSPAGATGIAQFMPGTAQGMGVDPSDPYASLDAGARLMKQNLDRYGGDYSKALAAYNAGPGNVDKYGGVPPFEETQRYIATILSGQTPTREATPQEGLARAGAAIGAAGPQDISQFGDKQLTNSEAYAACGPAAAIRFAQRFGRTPTLREAVDLARTVGWTEDQGMAGLDSEKALMDKLGIDTRLVRGGQWDAFAKEAQTGNPVTISTAGHYFTADGYNPQTGQFHVGRSGTDLKGGSEWMTGEQMERVMGPAQGALLANNPTVAAGMTSDTSGAPGAVSGPSQGPQRSALQVIGDELGGHLSDLTGGALKLIQSPAEPEQRAASVGAAKPIEVAGEQAVSPVPAPGGGYDPSSFSAQTTPPQEGVPLRQDVRDLNQPAQPTLLEPGGPVGDLLGRIGEAPGLSEADRAARRQAVDESPLGQAYGSQLRQQLLPNVTEPNHPANVIADLQDKYRNSDEPLSPEDEQRLREATLAIGGMIGGPKVDLAGLAGLRAAARASAAATAATATPAPPASTVDKILTVGVNNMLGGTASMFNNAVSGVSENLYRPFKTAVIQGEFGPAVQDLRGQAGAVGDALSDMATTFTSGKRLSNIGGTDYPEAFPGKVGMLPFTSGNLRANAAMDEGNRAIGMAGAMAAEMQRLMRQYPTLSQADIRARFGSQLLDAGMNAAKEATFEAGGTGIGDKVAGLRRKLTDPSATTSERIQAAAALVLVPFSKIPDVMLTRGVLGLPGIAEARGAVDVARGTRTAGQAIRQMGVTEAVNAAIAWQVHDGNITGNGPSDPDKKRVLMNARDANGDPIWQPNSFRVPTPSGTRWIPYSSLGPTAVRVGAIANLMEQVDDQYRQPDQNYLDAFSKATGETITDAWYLQNLGRMFQAMKNGKLFDMAGNAVLDFGERYVPDSALAYQMRQYLDPVQRDPRNPLEDVANRVPAASMLVPPKIDPATGQPTQAPKDVLSGLVRSPAPGQPDLTNEELARHNLGVAEAPKTITLPAVGKLPSATISITDDEQRRYQELTGRYIDQDVRAMIDQPAYKRLDKVQQQKILQDIIGDARKAAAKDIYTGLGADELNTRIDRYAEVERARAEPSVRLSP